MFRAPQFELPQEAMQTKNDDSGIDIIWASLRVFLIPTLYVIPFGCAIWIAYLVVIGTAGSHITVGPMVFSDPPVWLAVLTGLFVIAMSLTTVELIKRAERKTDESGVSQQPGSKNQAVGEDTRGRSD